MRCKWVDENISESTHMSVEDTKASCYETNGHNRSWYWAKEELNGVNPYGGIGWKRRGSTPCVVL